MDSCWIYAPICAIELTFMVDEKRERESFAFVKAKTPRPFVSGNSSPVVVSIEPWILGYLGLWYVLIRFL